MRVVFLSLLLTACTVSSDPDIVYQRLNIAPPTLDHIPHCRSYGCAKIDDVALDQHEQMSIKRLFKFVTNAQTERTAIAKSIAQFETMIGAKTGTDEDKAGTYGTLGHLQQDCIDESTNTTTYLMLLNQMGLLKFHEVQALTSRLPPHRTAVIREIATRKKFAVDSWFHDNGIDPEIIPLDQWYGGWHPAE